MDTELGTNQSQSYGGADGSEDLLSGGSFDCAPVQHIGYVVRVCPRAMPLGRASRVLGGGSRDIHVFIILDICN